MIYDLLIFCFGVLIGILITFWVFDDKEKKKGLFKEARK